MDENTHNFFTELTEPGTHRVQVTTLSSSGDCEARESTADTGFTFYLSTYTMASCRILNIKSHSFKVFECFCVCWIFKLFM